MTPNSKYSIVVGTIGEDAHVIGAWVLSEAFTQAGYNVSFLGAVVPQGDFVDAAIETNADAILVSSSYGMGIIDCEGLRDKCIEAGLDDIVLYAGGTVAAPRELEKNWPEIEARFSEMGFNKVFRNTTTAQQAVDELTAELDARREKR